ncbi:hypothetical protein [Desulfosarcina sp.]|uniref:hypothetical protein n=1 Tax=Desulfosarcina sp. TaxID=2027861 RepID=UPI0039705274
MVTKLKEMRVKIGLGDSDLGALGGDAQLIQSNDGSASEKIGRNVIDDGLGGDRNLSRAT